MLVFSKFFLFETALRIFGLFLICVYIHIYNESNETRMKERLGVKEQENNVYIYTQNRN
jgi:cbb3-type cytochrome oxidase subunit 3